MVDIDSVRALANELMAQHGIVGSSGWSFGFDHARRRAGQTDFARRRITLSAPLMRLYSESEVRGVLLHEIAHVLAGAGHHHDAEWKRIAQTIGADPQAKLSGAPQLPPLWEGSCPAGHIFGRYRKPIGAASCIECARAAAQLTGSSLRRHYDPRFRITWRNRSTGETL
ncbi:MAG: SprT-like domain-containing protein [Arcanobacterium sp.]|nr:SprT-like domain-containing protein [Arcanobacterium sp.]MDY5589680.1 SprT-like domain-containing protein [Arcanobacterium sp.]